MATRKRTRSTNVTEGNADHQQATTSTLVAASSSIPTALAASVNVTSRLPNGNATHVAPKRPRNHPPPTGPPPPVAPRTSYSLRNRSLTPDPRRPLSRFPSITTASTNRQRYNLRARRPQSQMRLPQVPAPQPVVAPRRFRRPIPPIAQTTLSTTTNTAQPSPSTMMPPPAPPASFSVPPPPLIPPAALPTPPAIQPRQYRLVYISDNDDDHQPLRSQPSTASVNAAFSLRTTEEDNLSPRSLTNHRRLSRSTSSSGLNTR